MKKQNLFLLAFAAISFNDVLNAKALPAKNTANTKNAAARTMNQKNVAATKKMASKNSVKEGNLVSGNLFGGKKDSTKVSDSSGVKAYRTEKHRVISKKNVEKMNEEDVFETAYSELESGKLYRTEYTSMIETLTKIDEKIKEDLAGTVSTYKACKSNEKNNIKIKKSKTSSAAEKELAKTQLNFIKKHESTMKEAAEMRKSFAEKTEGCKKNYNQVKKNLKVLSKRCDDKLKSEIGAFLKFNPSQAAQEKLKAEKKAAQQRRANVRQVKRGRREEALNEKHGGAQNVAAYRKGIQSIVEEKKSLSKQMNEMKRQASSKAMNAVKQSPEFKTLTPQQKNQKLKEEFKKAQLAVQKRADFIAIKKKMQEADKKITAQRNS